MESNSANTPVQSNDRWSKELDLLASIILKAPLEKTIKWGAEVFTYNGKNVLSYGGFKHYFALWFYNGVFLTDKHKVLVNAQEGITKSLRQWRFYSIAEIDERLIFEYINEAIEIEKKGLKIKPERNKPVDIPELLADALTHKDDFQYAFNKLTLGKQKEYIEYLNEAKQEATKLKRLEKIKPMILKGIGLNDKYK
ncbi:MAG: YdeI/OmpD-associated family protein [Bacteroidales bacterium]|nr:YdeI/OmpD-associated family protein [Bacteroidales bacterium]